MSRRYSGWGAGGYNIQREVGRKSFGAGKPSSSSSSLPSRTPRSARGTNSGAADVSRERRNTQRSRSLRESDRDKLRLASPRLSPSRSALSRDRDKKARNPLSRAKMHSLGRIFASKNHAGAPRRCNVIYQSSLSAAAIPRRKNIGGREGGRKSGVLYRRRNRWLGITETSCAKGEARVVRYENSTYPLFPLPPGRNADEYRDRYARERERYKSMSPHDDYDISRQCENLGSKRRKNV